MAITEVVEGTVVALYENSYDTFTAQDGSTVQGGTKRVLYVVANYNEAPRELRIRPENVSLLGSVKAWDQIKAECTLSGNVARPRYTVQSLQVVKAS